jgi:hypothetical protein
MDVQDLARHIWQTIQERQSLSTLVSPITRNFDNEARVTPLTTLQLVLGGTLATASTIGLLRHALFHPWLVGWPLGKSFGPVGIASIQPNATNLWGWPRIVVAFFMLGPSLTDTLRRMYTIYRYGGAVEKKLYHPLPTLPPGQTLTSQPLPPWLQRVRTIIKGVKPSINPYVKLQLVTLATVLLIEFSTTPAKPSQQQLQGTFLEGWFKQVAKNSYALTPILEYATLFTWAGLSQTLVRFGSFTESSDHVTSNLDATSLPPLLVPLGICASGFFTSWKDMLKGLLASMLAARICNLQRADAPPGEPREVYAWMMREWVGLLRWTKHWLTRIAG